MRIPGTGEEADVETKHYLTNYYAQVEFNLKTVPFDNTSNGFYYVKGQRFAIKGIQKVSVLLNVYARHLCAIVMIVFSNCYMQSIDP